MSANNLKEKARVLYAKCNDITKVSEDLKIPKTTVRRWCEDLVEEQRKVLRDKDAKRDEKVIAMRNEARLSVNVNTEALARKYGFGVSTTYKALTGLIFRHLNTISPPIEKVGGRLEEREKAREMRANGSSYSQIVAALGVSKSSVSLWCRSVTLDNPIPHTPKRVKPVVVAKPKTNKVTKLTDEQVIELRATIHAEGYLRLKVHAEKYDTNISSVSYAARGDSFRHLNEQYPPVLGKLPQDRGPNMRPPKPTLDGRLATEALEKRRTDPETWTYGAIARWLKGESGIEYRAAHVPVLLVRLDPSIKELEAIKPAPKPRVRKASKPKARVRKVLSVEELQRRAKEKRELEEAIAAEDALEAWVNAGKPHHPVYTPLYS